MDLKWTIFQVLVLCSYSIISRGYSPSYSQY